MQNWRFHAKPELGLANDISAALALLEADGTFALPDLRSFGHVLVSSDYSGEHKGVLYRTYGVLFAGEEGLREWNDARLVVRDAYLPNGRRMSFKDLRDEARQRALVPFLTAADKIPGVLFVLAVGVDVDNLFAEAAIEQAVNLFPDWKPGPMTKLLTLTHWISLFLGGLSAPDQVFTWITDKDAIAANDARLNDLGTVFLQTLSGYLPHTFKQVQVGTTANDPPDRFLEDLCGISDLCAGATAASLVPGGVRRRGDVHEKVRTIVGWMGQAAGISAQPPLRRVVLTIDKTPTGALHLVPIGFRRE